MANEYGLRILSSLVASLLFLFVLFCSTAQSQKSLISDAPAVEPGSQSENVSEEKGSEKGAMRTTIEKREPSASGEKEADPRKPLLPKTADTTDQTREQRSDDHQILVDTLDSTKAATRPSTVAFVISGIAAVIGSVFVLHGLLNRETNHAGELVIGSAVAGGVAVIALGTGIVLSVTTDRGERSRAFVSQGDGL